LERRSSERGRFDGSLATRRRPATACPVTSTREREIAQLKKSIERRKKHIERLKEHIADKERKIEELKNSKDKFIQNRVDQLERDIRLNKESPKEEEDDLKYEEYRLQGLESGARGC
jgi:predicted RNase H-like nuclease (RuvC/YqgF family)